MSKNHSFCTIFSQKSTIFAPVDYETYCFSYYLRRIGCLFFDSRQRFQRGSLLLQRVRRTRHAHVRRRQLRGGAPQPSPPRTRVGALLRTAAPRRHRHGAQRLHATTHCHRHSRQQGTSARCRSVDYPRCGTNAGRRRARGTKHRTHVPTIDPRTTTHLTRARHSDTHRPVAHLILIDHLQLIRKTFFRSNPYCESFKSKIKQ